MKKLIYCAAALATALFAGSCQQELLDTTAKETTVTYTVALPDAQTKAIGDAANVDQLIYEVWKTEVAGDTTLTNPATNAVRLYQDEARLVQRNGKTCAIVTFNLVQDQEYTILFWAQNSNGHAYNTENLTHVTYANGYSENDNFYLSNVEEYAAFYAVDFVSDGDPKNKTVILTRPFAQLNLGTLNTADKYTVTMVKSEVTVTDVPTGFNVAAKQALGEGDVVFNYNAVPNNPKVIDVNNVTYQYAAMNYLFADANRRTTTVTYNINSTLTSDAGEGAVTENVVVNNTIDYVPYTENYRTNIVGNLLTSTTQYEVIIDAEFNTPDDVVEAWNGSEVNMPKKNAQGQYEIEYPSQLAWLAAAVNGTLVEVDANGNEVRKDPVTFEKETFVLIKDIDLNNLLWTPIGATGKIFKGTFDGQNYTVKNLLITGNNSDVGLFGVTHDGEIKNFTVENAKVSGRLNVGVVAGYPYTSKYTNIKVKGHVEVNGMAYVGGVGGKNAYADWTNVTVNVDETSYVKANSVENGTAYRTYVGGVVGFNGEGSHSFTNITSNINVEGSTCDVGGLFGIAHYGNQFVKCVCTGNVEIYAAEEVDEAQEIGGIAGVWHNGGENVVMTDCSFDGELTTNIDGVNFYNGGLVGKPYSATGTGKLIINGDIYVASATQLQAAIDAATGETTIIFGSDIEGDVTVTVVQKQGVKITIDGVDKKYNGAIKVHSNSNYYADAALTIKNVNFETSAAGINVIEALENGSARYSQNITVDGCTFTATGEAVNTSVAVQVKATRGVTVTGCTATDMHSLIQAQSCDTGDVKVVNCTVNGKNGVAFKQVKSATVEGTTINALEYGIRFDGNIDNYGITVKDNTVTAAQPFIVRKMTGKDNTIALEGTNTLTTGETYQIVITNGSDDEAYVEPTGTYTLTGADDYVVYPAIEDYDAFLAKISDDTWYDDTKIELAIEDVADFAAFVETANSGNDFEGKTLKLTGDIDLYFKDVTALADGDPITFRPIGDTKYNGGKPFKGTFDGQGHTIKNLYQNGWDLGYQWGVYGSYGLFGSLDGATVKNVVIEGSESYIEGGDVSFIAGSATGNCVFENITINSGVAATYNNGCGGIIGWSGAGNYTFKNITIGKDAVLGGLWGSFDSSIGGIVGQAEPGATYNFENVTINGRIDAYNDCTASYDYYNYRMCGMIIGRCEETTTIDGKNYPDLSKYNMTFNNVVVNYGDWMNYHYCRKSGERAVRVEPGYAYGGAENRDHSNDDKHCMEWIPFNQLIGGDQYAVKGIPAVEGVTVNYPESYYRELGYKVEGNTYTVLTGKGFKDIATTVLSDASRNVTIELANDIDLAGIEWPAVKTAAAFVLDGKNHSIKNLTTSAVEDHGFYSTAMFTSTRKATTIKNLVVENATVTGKGGDNSHGAVLVACNYAALNIEGVTVKNSTVSNCDRSSVLVTYLYFTTATVKNCVVEGCTVNSIGTAGAVLGMNNSHNFEATGNTVKNTAISSSEGGNKAGILIGTWQNAGTLTESNNVVENSKAINAGEETNNNIGRRV